MLSTHTRIFQPISSSSLWQVYSCRKTGRQLNLKYRHYQHACTQGMCVFNWCLNTDILSWQACVRACVKGKIKVRSHTSVEFIWQGTRQDYAYVVYSGSRGCMIVLYETYVQESRFIHSHMAAYWEINIRAGEIAQDLVLQNLPTPPCNGVRAYACGIYICEWLIQKALHEPAGAISPHIWISYNMYVVNKRFCWETHLECQGWRNLMTRYPL